MADPGRPTDDTIALVAFLRLDGWLTADEIRQHIAELGFEAPSIQWVTGRLTAMSKEDLPRFERVRREGWTEYRVTSWAKTGLGNRWPGFATRRPDSPTPFPRAGRF